MYERVALNVAFFSAFDARDQTIELAATLRFFKLPQPIEYDQLRPM